MNRFIRSLSFVALLLVASSAFAQKKVLVQEQDGTPVQLQFCATGNGFSPTAANNLEKGTATEVSLQLSPSGTGVANNAARQSAKGDLGDNRAACYAVRAAFEFAATPTAGNTVELYWAPSSSATAGTGNAAAVTGADGAYSGYTPTLAAYTKHLVYIGTFVCTAQATGTVQVAEIGRLCPTERYGSLVVYNKSGAAFHSDDDECHIVFDPIVPEVQP